MVGSLTELLKIGKSITVQAGTRGLLGHAKIRSAVRDGDGAAARELMTMHIAQFESNLKPAMLREAEGMPDVTSLPPAGTPALGPDCWRSLHAVGRPVWLRPVVG